MYAGGRYMKHEKKILHFASLGQVCNTDIFGTSIFFFYSVKMIVSVRSHMRRVELVLAIDLITISLTLRDSC